jgi:hypothetical protein
MNLTARLTRRVTAVAALSGVAILIPAIAQATTGTVAARAAGAPAKFKAASLSWRSPEQGFVLGAAPCAKKTCADVLGTTNGAKSWTTLGQVPYAVTAQNQDSATGVQELYFGSATVGWAFTPSLARTVNGGKTWTKLTIPGGGKQVLDLASGKAGVYLITSACKLFTTCKTPLTLWRSASLTGKWSREPVTLPWSDGASVSTAAGTVYVVDGNQTKTSNGTLYASTDGRHFAARPSPCKLSQDLGLVQAVPTSSTGLAVLCVGNPGFSKAVKTVYLSKNTGRTYTSAGTAGALGIPAEIAVSPAGSIAMASWSNGSFLYLNSTHKKTWKMVAGLGDGGDGFGDLQWVSSKVAWAVHGPITLFHGNLGTLYVTRDGGQKWSSYSF